MKWLTSSITIANSGMIQWQLNHMIEKSVYSEDHQVPKKKQNGWFACSSCSSGLFDMIESKSHNFILNAHTIWFGVELKFIYNNQLLSLFFFHYENRIAQSMKSEDKFLNFHLYATETTSSPAPLSPLHTEG